ncbi:MAG: tRNA (adenosine(37)-N6)-threonylcarbamoyltransferase complex dimerization subunit type 1 TsaB [Oscillospiraceae bacterium]|nr:tRNA (adenosine(37)-N6)-threonylcarbamoyltransferase complex dimerization subunit type 1 TsaB [Oscillospiraceae bacterium]
MNLLAIDASSLPASCAFFRGEMLVAEEYLHNRMTHSQTLMPMVEHMMQNAGAFLQEVDAVAVTIGPGSFTGLRIGIAAAKGIAWGCGKPCVPVSTLRALACNGLCHKGVVCAVMDARCAQVYTALFESDGAGKLTPLGQDEAIALEELKQRLAAIDRPILLVGDGARLCYNSLENKENVVLAPATLQFQRAGAVGLAALGLVEQGFAPIPAEELAPAYLRLPQAERELLQRQAAQNK